MNAIIYLIVRQYINRIKRLFRKPLSAVLTVLAVLFFIGGPILMMVLPVNYDGIVSVETREIFIAGVQLFLGITFILSALSQQSGLFTYNEAIILFSSPFSKRTILLYSTIQTLPAAILTALFMCFYFPFIIGGAMTQLKLLGTLLVMSLMMYCVYILYYYIYIQDIAHAGLKKKLKKFVWLFFAAVLAAFAATWLANGRNAGDAAVAFFTSTAYNAFPVLGWAKWAVAALLNDDYITGFIPATLLLAAASYLLARIYYSQEVDFYEKAQLDSIRLQKVMDSIKSNGYDAGGISIQKVRKTKAEFRPGAAAIMSRQLIEMKKRGPMLTFKDFFTGIIYIVIGLAAGLDFEVVIFMIIFFMVSDTTTDIWNNEFKKPYIYLIPEKSTKKLVYAVLPSLIKTAVTESIVTVAAAVIFGAGIRKTIFFLLLLLSYNFLFTSAGVFTHRIMGKMTNAAAQAFVRVLFVMASAVPGGVLAIILYVLTESSSVLFVPVVLINVLTALLFVFMSRTLLEQSEILN